jgi:hypothetical protein
VRTASPNSLVFLALVVAGIAAAPREQCLAMEPATTEPPSIAARLVEVLDERRPDLAAAVRLKDSGHPADAVRAVVDVLARRCAELPPQRGYGYWLHAPVNADELLAGRLTTARYGDPATHYTVAIGPPGRIDFFKAADGYPLTARDISSMHWASKLAEAYATTRDPKYLQGWCDTWADFAAHWDDQFKDVQNDPEIWGKGPDGQQKLPGIGWVNNTLYTGWRLQAMREGLVGVLQTATAARQVDRVDVDAVAAVLLRIATREGPHARGLLKRAASTTPNQARSMAMELFRAGCLFPLLKDSAAWRSEPLEVVFLTNLPDGSDREQSLNYFTNHFKELPDFIRRYVPEAERDPAQLARIEQASTDRNRFLPSIARPDGFPPATGTDPVWSRYGKTRPLAPPSRAFTSILFPYGGYAVQRDGWTPESRYLFMKVSRPSKGHWRSQDGGLQVSAFGRNLLVSPIGEVYDARDNDRGWRSYWDSGVSQNTIVVDGMAAAERTGDFTALDTMRWHAGGRIDFMETEIRGPYKGPNFRARASAERPDVTDVAHRRQVHFLRDAGCWIVTDRVTSETQHDFTQSWCFGPEYAEGEVVVESAGEGRGARIATTQADAPNLSLHQFGIAGLAHRKYFGVYDDDRILGWVGILADREKWIYTPAINVHANWRGQGSQLLVTLVVPHEGSERRVTIDSALAEGQGTAAGFDATLTSGLRISFRASTTTAPFEALGVKADAASLVVCRTPDGESTGVALDATTFNGRPASVKDFEFEIPAGADDPQTVAITVPTGFHWEGSGAGLQPRYTPATAAETPSAHVGPHRQMHPLVSAELGLDADQEELLDRGTLPLAVSGN